MRVGYVSINPCKAQLERSVFSININMFDNFDSIDIEFYDSDIKEELMDTGREGMDRLIKELLEEKGYFIKPASDDHHSNHRKGLMVHSTLVRKKLRELNNSYEELQVPWESQVIEGYLHDVAKLDDYILQENDVRLTDGQLSYLSSLYRKFENFNDKFSIEIDFTNPESITKSYASDMIGWYKYIEDNNLSIEEANPPPEPGGFCRNSAKEYPLGHGEKSIIMIQEYINLKPREMMAIRWHMGGYDKQKGSNNMDRAEEMYEDVKMLQIADMEATFIEDNVIGDLDDD